MRIVIKNTELAAIFGMAFNFMKSFCRYIKQKHLPIKTIWKYILFSHNDSDEQIISALELAEDANVDELMFIITYIGPRSLRITDARNIKEICMRRLINNVDKYMCFSEKMVFRYKYILDNINRNPIISKMVFILTRVFFRREIDRYGNSQWVNKQNNSLIVTSSYCKPNIYNLRKGYLMANQHIKKNKCLDVSKNYLFQINTLLDRCLVDKNNYNSEINYDFKRLHNKVNQLTSYLKLL